MRLAGREGRAFLRRPDPAVAAVLVSGEDAARVMEARDALVLAIAGQAAEAEMRLDRLAGADLRADPARLIDAVKAVGFFPGPRAVVLTEATDGLAPTLGAALDAWREGDARLVVTGGALTAKGALRKLVEGRRGAVAIHLYDDPPTPAEVEERLRAAGLTAVEPEAREALLALAQGMGPGGFRDLLEKLALHRAGGAGPLSAATVAALAPEAEGAELDELLAAVTDGRRDDVAALLGRLTAQGTGPVAVAIGAGRHLRAVLAAASDPGGPAAGIGRLRPPPGGPRRAAILRAASSWRRERIEEGVRALLALDLQLRSGGEAPEAALVERVLLRLARPGREG